LAVPRPPRHPFTVAVRRTLPRPLEPAAERYLRLLDRRFTALARIAAGAQPRAVEAGMRPEERALARRFCARRSWHDGDENLVRGYLDRWEKGAGPGGAAERARGVLEGASALSGIGPPPGALWFFLWEMESVLAGLVEADKGDGPC
jgi:hypothetical protein